MSNISNGLTNPAPGEKEGVHCTWEDLAWYLGSELGICQGGESGVLLQGGTLWHSQKDASTSETRPFPGPLHPGLYLQTILVTPPLPHPAARLLPRGRTDISEVEWEVGAFCRLCLDQAGGSPGSVFRKSSGQLDLFCELKGEADLARHTPRPILRSNLAQSPPFSPFPGTAPG